MRSIAEKNNIQNVWTSATSSFRLVDCPAYKIYSHSFYCYELWFIIDTRRMSYWFLFLHRFVSVPSGRFGHHKATSWWLLFNQMAKRYGTLPCALQFVNLLKSTWLARFDIFSILFRFFSTSFYECCWCCTSLLRIARNWNAEAAEHMLREVNEFYALRR